METKHISRKQIVEMALSNKNLVAIANGHMSIRAVALDVNDPISLASALDVFFARSDDRPRFITADTLAAE